MPTTTSTARWEGDLKSGRGRMTVGDDRWSGEFSYVSRFESGADADRTNPEELLAAAHAGCFSMALSNELDKAGHPPTSVATSAAVTLEGGAIARVVLTCEATVPGIDDDTFQRIAGEAKEGCPVSQLFDTDIQLEASLTG